MGGQRRAAAAGSRKTSTGERKRGSGHKPASATRRNTPKAPRESTPKVRKTAPPKVDPNSNAGALATEISALVEAAVPPAASQAYAELEREANTILADATPTIKAAAVKPRVHYQGDASAAPRKTPAPDTSSPGSSGRRHRTLSSMSGAWNRAEISSAITSAAPEEVKAEAEATEAPHAQCDEQAGRPVSAASEPLGPHATTQKHTRRYWATASASIAAQYRMLPGADLIIPMTAVHTALAVAAAGAGAVFAMLDQPQLAITTLLLTGVLGVGAALARTFAETLSSKGVAAGILIASQLGGVLWAFLLIGYRPSLLLLIPGLIALALRLAGPPAGYAMAAGAALLYCVSAWASFNGYFQPRLPLDAGALLFIDTVVVLVGVSFFTWALLSTHNSQVRALNFARARRYEAATLRDQLTTLRHDTEGDAEWMQSALVTALSGDAVEQKTLRSMLSPLGEAVRTLTERVQTLQRDREERLRLEGAVRRMILAAQRKRLGLPWTWPEPSGTLADELMAVLPGQQAPLAEGTLEKELESLTQVSEFDVEELAARPRVPSWPRPASRTLATLMQSRKRPSYLRPVDPSALDTPSVPDPESPLAEENYSIGEP